MKAIPLFLKYNRSTISSPEEERNRCLLLVWLVCVEWLAAENICGLFCGVCRVKGRNLLNIFPLSKPWPRHILSISNVNILCIVLSLFFHHGKKNQYHCICQVLLYVHFSSLWFWMHFCLLVPCLTYLKMSEFYQILAFLSMKTCLLKSWMISITEALLCNVFWNPSHSTFCHIFVSL